MKAGAASERIRRDFTPAILVVPDLLTAPVDSSSCFSLLASMSEPKRYGIFEGGLASDFRWISNTASLQDARRVSEDTARSSGHACFVYDFLDWEPVFVAEPGA